MNSINMSIMIITVIKHDITMVMSIIIITVIKHDITMVICE
jgi:hypothetical protein